MRFVALLLIGLLPLAPAQAAEAATKSRANDSKEVNLSQFRKEITDHVSQSKFGAAMWGIKIVSLDSGKTLFETNANKLLKPASNAKVFTGAMALDVLGPEYRIRTSLLAKNAPEAGVLKGDLVVYGRGDPSFAARFHENSYTNLLAPVVNAIRNAGVKRVNGDLVGDETFFTGPPYGANWTWDDLQYYYGAEVSALTYQDNVIDLFIRPARLGEPCEISLKPQTSYLEFINRTRTTATNIRPSITITRPLNERRAYVTGTLPLNHAGWADAVTVPRAALWFVTALREALEREGISVTGKLRTRSSPDDPKTAVSDYKELAFVDSAPVREIAARLLKPSQNLYAQLLLLQAGAQSKSPAIETENAGLAELKTFLRRAGIDPDEVLMDEGSGLSRSALVTPNALVTLHRFMATHPQAAIYREALPAPGEGTLRTRFRDLAGADLRAKTGTLRYVNTLSGYIDSKADERLAFAILLNAYDNDSSTSSRDELDVIVRLMANLREKTR
jgi:serine-type D-Ala-D-Ala carboxypeptidase/endopeptidase (penicillin-binding protein 4)